MRIGDYVLNGVACMRADGPMWRTHAAGGQPALATFHTQADADRLQDRWKRWARISHPHIVQLYDVVRHKDGRWMLIQAEINGDTLADLLDRHDEILRLHGAAICSDLTSAVSALHDEGFVHGDLSPRNIMVTTDGKARIIDMIGFSEEENGTPGWNGGTHSQEDDLQALRRLKDCIEHILEKDVSKLPAHPEDPGVRLRLQSQQALTERYRPERLRLSSFFKTKKKRALKLPDDVDDNDPNNLETSPYLETEETPRSAQQSGERNTTTRPQQDTTDAHPSTRGARPQRILATGMVLAGAIMLWSFLTSEHVHVGESMNQARLSPSQSVPLTSEESVPQSVPTVGTSIQTPHDVSVSPCADQTALFERMRTIFKARNAAFNHRSAEGLEKYLGDEVLKQDLDSIQEMTERNISVKGFTTSISDETLEMCHKDLARIRAQVTVNSYSECVGQECQNIEPGQVGTPLSLVLDIQTMRLTHVDEVKQEVFVKG